jgi:small subunit ribosomal protein S9
MAVQYFEGIGRRKESTARVRIAQGAGQFVVNEKPLVEYFTRGGDAMKILGTMQVAGEDPAQLDVTVIVMGGGVTGQTSAVTMGLARALVLMRPDTQKLLRNAGLLTRDSRIKERKKPGLKRARKAPTYTKR